MLDVAVANLFSDDVSVLRGLGDGRLQLSASFDVGELPRSVARADLDGDGIPDLVTANTNSDDVSVLV